MSSSPGPIRKLLIANRGEIALRVMRTARVMGIRTIAVYSDADAGQRHVLAADEAIPIGGAEPSESYLDPDRILAACRKSGADAVHPGYGFLSERAEFSESCRDAGLAFVGPPPEAMRLIGDKISAKRLATEAGVPVAPGFFEPGADRSKLSQEAARIGYPLMLKASAGGGGRGMRVVHRPEDFDSTYDLAQAEAISGFGDGAMMVERYVPRPRHVEVQFLADAHGTSAALFERECSLQRRHQKLVEESPSPWLAQNPDRWPAMRDATLALVHAAGYVGAGTAEFIVDEATGEFYFLEVNARLQVEHPVTEAVAGLDLVAWQIRIAQGERLQLPSELEAGDRRALRGCAIEARIVAEDPARGFLPSAGRIVGWAEPQGPGIRVDTGYGPGSVIPRYYDSLAAKVIAHGADRSEAVARLRQALLDFHILGVPTNLGYLLDVTAHPDFEAGRFDTSFLEREFGDWDPGDELPAELGAILELATANSAEPAPASGSAGAWAGSDGFRNARAN